jgi:hypothetical protein
MTIMNATKVSGIAIAAVAASLFVLAPIATAADAGAATGKCVGGNACKGKSECKSASNSCKGQNSCKGKGFATMTKADCDKAGGKFEAAGGK